MRGKAVMTTAHLRQMDAMWRNGDTVDEIAYALGISRWTVMGAIRANRGRYPNRYHHADWWRERLKEVEGLPSTVAARKIGCSYETVCSWRRRLNGDA